MPRINPAVTVSTAPTAIPATTEVPVAIASNPPAAAPLITAQMLAVSAFPSKPACVIWSKTTFNVVPALIASVAAAV